jgi:uncharacterized cupin superfamily protein
VEARVEQTEHGLKPTGPGWYVVNARDVRWWQTAGTRMANLGGDAPFDQLGAGVDFLGPGEPMAAYHREADQEDFVVLAGAGTVVLDGEEHPLRQWDVVHCPPGTPHIVIGGPMVVFAVGAREHRDVEYITDPVAAKFGAAPELTTTNAEEAYAGWERPTFTGYGGWLD